MLKLINKALLSKVFGIEWPHWTKFAFWTIGLLLMTGLTIKDLCPLVVNYYDDDQNTQVQISLKHPDEEIRAPNLHVCIPMANYSVDFHNYVQALIDNIARGKECAQCAIMANHSYDVWNREDSMHVNEAVEDIDRVSELLLDMFVAEIAENGVENSAITVGNLSWNRPLVYSLIEYLSRETEMETSLVNTLRPESSSVHQQEQKFPSSLSANRLDKLYSVIVSLVCEMFIIYSRGPSVCVPLFRSSSVMIRGIFTDSPLFCGQLPLEHLEELRFRTSRIYFEKFLEHRHRILVTIENPLRNTRRNNVLYGIGEGIDADEVPYEAVMITSYPQYAVLEDRPSKLGACYGESSKFECESNCYVDLMESICGCRACAYRRASSDRPAMSDTLNSAKLCTSGEFLLCKLRLRNYSSSTVNICPERCSLACHSTVYQWHVSAGSIPDEYTSYYTMDIEARRQAYLEFKMSVKDSSEDFISQIGGVLSFYLGLSGLSIILFLDSLFDITRKFIQRKRQGTGTNNHDQQNSASASVPVHYSATTSATPELGEELSLVLRDVVVRVDELRKVGQLSKEKREKLEKQMHAMTDRVHELNTAVRAVHRAISDRTGQ